MTTIIRKEERSLQPNSGRTGGFWLLTDIFRERKGIISGSRLLNLISMISAFCLVSCNTSNNAEANKKIKIENMVEKQMMEDDGIIRLSKIEVYPEHIDEYLTFAREVGAMSLLVEPGVLTMYAMQDKAKPCSITILETYARREAYRCHIASEHFQRYKQGTQHMVKSLELCDQTPVNPRSKIENIIE